MPDFDDDVELDTSQVEDLRGAAGGGRRRAEGQGRRRWRRGRARRRDLGLLLGVDVTGGGGAGGLGSLQDLQNQTAGTRGEQQRDRGGVPDGRGRGPREDCRIVGYVNSIQAYWTRAFQDGATSRRRRVSSAASRPAAAPASSAVGPFYCPADRTSTSISASSTS